MASGAPPVDRPEDPGTSVSADGAPDVVEETDSPGDEQLVESRAAGAPWFTPSDVLEYLYCPRFLYYERVLGIPEHQELRLKVQLGRELHHDRAHSNVAYLRKKLGVVRKEIDVHLASERLRLSGRVDEVLFLENGEAAPLDYKFAEWDGRVYLNQRVQSLLYAAMIHECLGLTVSTGYVAYVRGAEHIEKLVFTPTDFLHAEAVLARMQGIVQSAHFPGATKTRNRCPDCCYRNICPR